jgi:hypothetical protein
MLPQEARDRLKEAAASPRAYRAENIDKVIRYIYEYYDSYMVITEKDHINRKFMGVPRNVLAKP